MPVTRQTNLCIVCIPRYRQRTQRLPVARRSTHAAIAASPGGLVQHRSSRRIDGENSLIDLYRKMVEEADLETDRALLEWQMQELSDLMRGTEAPIA